MIFTKRKNKLTNHLFHEELYVTTQELLKSHFMVFFFFFFLKYALLPRQGLVAFPGMLVEEVSLHQKLPDTVLIFHKKLLLEQNL